MTKRDKELGTLVSGAAPTRNDEWGKVPDAQRRFTYETGRTALVTNLDIGSITTVHPPDKQDLGCRLALLARKHVYGENVTADSPTFLCAQTENSVMHVWFDHAQGLHLSQTGMSDLRLLARTIGSSAQLQELMERRFLFAQTQCRGRCMSDADGNRSPQNQN